MLVHKPIVLPPRRDLLSLSSKPQESHPLHQHLEIMSYFRQRLESSSLLKEAIDIIMNSLSLGTIKQYGPVIKQWVIFCSNSSIDPFTASVTDGIEFLTTLFYSKEIGYSSVNTATSALSLVIEPRNGISFGSNPLVQRYMKGMFRLKPTLPRYTATYDASRVVFFKTNGTFRRLTLKESSMKLAMLLMSTYCKQGSGFASIRYYSNEIR